MEAKRTPGPWAIDQNGTRLDIINAETEFTICTTRGISPLNRANAEAIVRAALSKATGQ